MRNRTLLYVLGIICCIGASIVGGIYLEKKNDLVVNFIIRDDSHIGWIAFDLSHDVKYVGRYEKNLKDLSEVCVVRDNPVGYQVYCDYGKMEFNFNKGKAGLHLLDKGNRGTISSIKYFDDMIDDKTFTTIFFTRRSAKFPKTIDDLWNFDRDRLVEFLELYGVSVENHE